MPFCRGLFTLKENCHDKHRYHQRRAPGSITPQHRSVQLPPKGTAVLAAKAANLSRMATPDLDTHLGTALPDAELPENPLSWARPEGIDQPLSCSTAAPGVPFSHRHSGHRPFPTDRRPTDEYHHPGSVPHGRISVRRPARVRVCAPFVEVDGLRMHYLDEGPAGHTGAVLSRRARLGYLYRHMLRALVAAGHRVVVPGPGRLRTLGQADRPAVVHV